MRRSIFLTLAAALLAAGPAIAQEDQGDVSQEERAAAERREGEPRPGENLIDRIRRASRLPRAADEAREAGVPEEEVQEVLSTGKRRAVPAGDVETVLEEEAQASRRDERTGEFGGLVRQKMEEGLRGHELIEAVRQERAARRAGRPRGEDPARERAESPGTPRQRQRQDTGPAGHDRTGDHVIDRYVADERADDEFVDDRPGDAKKRGGASGQRGKGGRKEDR